MIFCGIGGCISVIFDTAYILSVICVCVTCLYSRTLRYTTTEVQFHIMLNSDTCC